MTYKVGDVVSGNVTGRVPWATNHSDPQWNAVRLTWVADDQTVVEGYAQPPRGSRTKVPVKITLPTCRISGKVEG